MKNKRVLPALLGSVALTLGLVTVSTSINKEVVNAAEGTWTLVTDASTLQVGDKVVITNNDSTYALSTNQKSSNRGAVAITKVDDSIVINSDVQELTLTEGKSNDQFGLYTGEGYLYASSTSGNQLKTKSELDDNGSWKIDIAAETSIASVVATNSSNRNVMQYNPNNGSPLFACYASASQTSLLIYKLEDSYDYTKLASTVNKYYNLGTYTKKTEIRLNDSSKIDIETHFHGSVQKDRTTYYTKENGRDALFMADLNGKFDKVNSGYSTVNASNIEEVKAQLPKSKVEVGYMAHYSYKNGKAVYDYVVAKEKVSGNDLKDGIQDFYVTLDDMLEEGYFSSWTSNQYNVTGKEDKYLLDFLAFAAPCLEDTILETEYITVEDMILEVSEGTNTNNAKDYLSLKILVDATNYGIIGSGDNNKDLVLAEARIYSGNVQFDENEMSSEVVAYNQELAQKALDTLDISKEISSDSESFPTEGINNAVISWTSNSDVIVIDGGNATITRGNADVVVTLTATAVVNGVSVSKEFDVTVKSVAVSSFEFNLGANGSASHNDGNSKTTYSEIVGDYTLSITGGTNMYTGARDAKGNSCIKLGSSKATGSMTINVPADVTSVVIYAAKYKSNTTKITVNGTAYTLTKNSNDGAYDVIVIDTTSTKTVTFSTVSGGIRCMVNTIEFVA